MREIKFRGKRTYGKWLYGDLITSPNGLLHYIVEKKHGNEYYMKNNPPIEVDSESVGQFTGREDKKKNIICGSDILKCRAYRLSGSHGSWYKKTNKAHGIYYINMLVKWNEEDLQYVLVPNKEAIKKLEQPMGKETTTQVVQYPYDLTKETLVWFKNDIEIIGNTTDNPELLEEIAE